MNQKSISKNLSCVLNEHCLEHEKNGYLNRNEAKRYLNILKKFHNFKENFNFDHYESISYDDFVSKVAPFII